MTRPRLRFAPSPTGYLHIGGARTALFNWLWARKTGGTFILRIEDTDQERSTAASRAAIFESLRWLGLDWDEGPSDGAPDRGSHGPYTQSQRLSLYAEFADKLIRSRHAYRCYCTEAELGAQREAFAIRIGKPKKTAGFKYPGTCRGRTDQPDLPYVVRLVVDRERTVTYTDKVFGDGDAQLVSTPTTELQDFVLLRADGVPLYNFGAVVDDITMDITLVARGRDHMVNTPPQVLIYQALGARVPVFAHLPMMLAQDGTKLSKRHGAVSVTEYRELGYSPDAVLDYLSRFGWSAGEIEQRLSRDELIAAFDWAQCGRADGKFDPQKFGVINYHHLKTPRLTPDYVDRALPFVRGRGLDVSTDAFARVLPAIRERAQTFVQAADLADPFLREPPALDDKAKKFLTPAAAAHLRGIRDAFAVTEWTASILEDRLASWLGEHQLDLKAVGQPLRVALTGRTSSPSLFEVLEILGRDVALARLSRAAELAER